MVDEAGRAKTRSVPASISKTAFECPHCGAYTTQYWFQLGARPYDTNETPRIFSEEILGQIRKDTNLPEKARKDLLKSFGRLIVGDVVKQKIGSGSSSHFEEVVNNLNLSMCYACGEIAVWVHDRLLNPPERSGPQPNPDLPDDIIHDYEEARSILNLSPRGAAALLRLAIQKLCKNLGEKGKNIDDDIASLISKGLDPRVQQALDVVRVVGNEAVHPGSMDLRDDCDTAEQLFGLINLIAEQMISVPKHLKGMYEGLPPDKLKAIEARNKKAKATP